MIITIASGKGGTGKTTVAVNLAYALSAENETVRLLDCDVEEPNDFLFLKPEFEQELPVTVNKPVWDASKCTGCGACAKACQYNALAVVKGKVLIFNELCHSCGVCTYVCPEQAFTEAPYEIGQVQIAEKGPFFFAQGLLKIGESLAPKVIKSVKAHMVPEAINLVDAPPGTSCPVVEAVSDADVVLLVTEPTPLGLHDLKLAVSLAQARKTPTGIVINRSDGQDTIIHEFAKQAGVPVVGRIPFERKYAEAYSRGEILASVFPEFKVNLLDIYQQVTQLKGTPVASISVEEDVQHAQSEEACFKSGHASGFRELTIISGKGGTGKTTVTAAFAHLAHSKVLADNDVDAANLHLLLNPGLCESHDFSGGKQAAIDSQVCTGCGLCAEYCHFQAIHKNDQGTFGVDPLGCEGCSLCQLVCPAEAVQFHPVVNGQMFVSTTNEGPMVHARLGIAEENSGKLVTDVRRKAAELAGALKLSAILADGPPGTGCPVIASITGTHHVLIVTEPTVSGRHDLTRVLELTRHFNVPASVVVNKYDINEDQTRQIEALAGEHHAHVIGKIPFDPLVHQALMAGKNLIEYGQGPAYQAIVDCWEILRRDILKEENR